MGMFSFPSIIIKRSAKNRFLYFHLVFFYDYSVYSDGGLAVKHEYTRLDVADDEDDWHNFIPEGECSNDTPTTRGLLLFFWWTIKHHHPQTNIIDANEVLIYQMEHNTPMCLNTLFEWARMWRVGWLMVCCTIVDRLQAGKQASRVGQWSVLVVSWDHTMLMTKREHTTTTTVPKRVHACLPSLVVRSSECIEHACVNRPKWYAPRTHTRTKFEHWATHGGKWARAHTHTGKDSSIVETMLLSPPLPPFRTRTHARAQNRIQFECYWWKNSTK